MNIELKDGDKVVLVWSELGVREYQCKHNGEGFNLYNVISGKRYDRVDYPTVKDLQYDLKEWFYTGAIHQIEVGGKIWKTRL